MAGKEVGKKKGGELDKIFGGNFEKGKCDTFLGEAEAWQAGVYVSSTSTYPPFIQASHREAKARRHRLATRPTRKVEPFGPKLSGSMPNQTMHAMAVNARLNVHQATIRPSGRSLIQHDGHTIEWNPDHMFHNHQV